MAELVETYIDLPLGIVDAAVIAMAERLRLTEIASWTTGTSISCGQIMSRHSRSSQAHRLSDS